MSGPPTLRKATPADLPALEALENSVFPGDRLSRRSLRYYVGAATASFLVLAEGSRVVGDAIVAYRRNSDVARLYTLAIRTDETGQGFGRRLLAACEAAAREHGKVTLRLEVRADNAKAVRLYEAARYSRFGSYEDYYEDGATALRFEKRLG